MPLTPALSCRFSIITQNDNCILLPVRTLQLAGTSRTHLLAICKQTHCPQNNISAMGAFFVISGNGVAVVVPLVDALVIRVFSYKRCSIGSSCDFMNAILYPNTLLLSHLFYDHNLCSLCLVLLGNC